MHHTWTRFRWTVYGLLAAAMLALLAEPGRSEEEEKAKSRDQKIADIEKQIGELNKKLTELRKADQEKSAGPTSLALGLPAEWIKPLTWRCIGPANMSGRVTAISVYEADPSTFFVATASGGLLKTVNNGITFEHQFDREATVSIGDVCVAPSNKDIVWVGTGEANPRNSVSYGDGVYKSTDGGKTWKNMGLKKSFQIGKIVIHPEDPNIVYVGALGRLYGPHEERGLYKTTNGGDTWERVLYVDDKTGVVDIRMHPTEPDTLIAATWERQRDEFDGFFGTVEGDQYGPVKYYAPGTGLHKTTDGGKSFKKLTQGLPDVKLGRIGLDWYRKDPNIVYAIIDSEKVGTGPPRISVLRASGDKGKNGVEIKGINPDGPGGKAGVKAGDVITAVNGKDVDSVQALNNQLREFRAGQKFTVKVLRDEKDTELTVALEERPAGSRGQGGGFGGGGGGRSVAGTAALGALGEDSDAGPKLTRLMPDGPAEKAGLQEGDLVKAIDKKPIELFQQLAEHLQNRKEGDKIVIQIKRGDETKDVELTVGSAAGRGASARRPYGSGLGGQEENVQAEQGADGVHAGGLYRSNDAGETWVRVNSVNPRPMYFSKVRVDPSDDKNLYVLGVSQYKSSDGGKTFTADFGRRVHSDAHALWIDPKDGRHCIIGCDGGFYATYDRGAHWDHLNHLALGQFYHVAVDPRPRYYAYGGLQDNGTWGGPADSRRLTGPVNEDWVSVGGGDGFVCAVDRNDPDLVYFESQGGAMGRRNFRTGETASIRPPRPAQGRERYRFNWKTPFMLSHHNSRIFYCAGNFVFRSLDRGNDLRIISPEITRTKQGSGTALAESPRNPNVLWAGTDDGNLWITKDGGKEWVNVADKVGLPGPRWVATIEASRFEEGRAYVCSDGHRSDDDDPHVYVTEDFGQTWKPLRANLPWGSTRCLREDLKNANVLYVGTEFAAWVSIDRGASWTKFNNNLPTVAVHEFAQHPTTGEIVAATHGRSLWILDVTPLRQMNKEVLAAAAHLFQPKTAVRYRPEPNRGGTNRRFVGQNPPTGAQIHYSLGSKAEQISLKVVDYTGKTVTELRANGAPGFHQVTWNLSQAPTRTLASNTAEPGPNTGARSRNRGERGNRASPAARSAPAQQPDTSSGNTSATAQQPGGGTETETATQPGSGPGAPGGPGGFGGRGGIPGRAAAPGMYRVVLTVDGKEFTQPLKVEADASAPSTIIAEDDE
jgi:photosystem II stability/assembly factor-like uncharacterized protein